MASLVSEPLTKFRKADAPLPLHSRWGDTEISVPTDGSWCQFDNPHHNTTKERQCYEPGFVPGNSLDEFQIFQRQHEKRAQKDDKHKSSRRVSISRLSVCLPGSRSRYPRARGESPISRGRESLLPESKRMEFAYMPIQKDYLSEMSEKSKQTAPNPFRYIPVSTSSQRSQSARSFETCHSRRGSSVKLAQDQEPAVPLKRDSHQENVYRDMALNHGEPSDVFSRRAHSPLRTSSFVLRNRKRSSSLKPMTLTMVPDPEELY